MNEVGYIKWYRKILDWQWYDDPYVLKTFMTLCVMANYKDGYFLDKKIKRGQLATSIRKLSAIMNMDKDAVNRCLRCLEKSGDVKIKRWSKFSVITICNYEEYQGVPFEGTDEGTDEGTGHRHNQRNNKNKENSSFGGDKPQPKREESRGRQVMRVDQR